MKIKSSLCAGLAALLLVFPSCSGTLKDVTKPYLGEYECKSAKLGEKDYAEEFTSITLELKSDDTFLLRYHAKNGMSGEETGEYVYDQSEQTLTLRGGENGAITRKFPLKDGVLQVTLGMGSQTLALRFEQK